MRKRKFTRTINRNDWSGKEDTYKYSKNKVYIYDYTFDIVRHKSGDEIWADIYGDDWSREYPLFTAYYIDGKWRIISSGVEREAERLHDVVAMIVWNTV